MEYKCSGCGGPVPMVYGPTFCAECVRVAEQNGKSPLDVNWARIRSNRAAYAADKRDRQLSQAFASMMNATAGPIMPLLESHGHTEQAAELRRAQVRLARLWRVIDPTLKHC